MSLFHRRRFGCVVVAALAAGACEGGLKSMDASSGGSDAASRWMPDPVCHEPVPLGEDVKSGAREVCTFMAGARVEETLGLSPEERAQIPIRHLVVVMEENRSFDHYFGMLHAYGQPAAEGPPPTWSNPDTHDVRVFPFPLTSTCSVPDPPHQWDAMHQGWDHGAMDGFVQSASAVGDGHFVMGQFSVLDLPFYYWMASTFAISDRYFAATLGGTWANRDYLYAATSNGVENTGDAILTGVPTIFDQLDEAGVRYGVYTDGNPRQDCLGWTVTHPGVANFSTFLIQMATGTLPPVSFVDPWNSQDEHPPGDSERGEAWARQIYEAAVHSPLWPQLAVIFTYDESGGMADHVPPPPACIPTPDQTAFDVRGVRVPLTVVSPWARRHYVSHRVHDHTSILRLIQTLHDLPALTARDANSDALLDLFDFGCPALANPAPAPASGVGGCHPLAPHH